MLSYSILTPPLPSSPENFTYALGRIKDAIIWKLLRKLRREFKLRHGQNGPTRGSDGMIT
jgi:hypothetical protein